MALLPSAKALLLRGAGTFYYASAPLFSTVSYLQVPIVLCPSHSLLPVYTSKHLYDKYLNNGQYENKVSQLLC